MHDPDGVEVSRTFRTKRAAVVYEAEQLSAKARGGWVDPREAARITVEMLAVEWMGSNPAKRGVVAGAGRDRASPSHLPGTG